MNYLTNANDITSWTRMHHTQHKKENKSSFKKKNATVVNRLKGHTYFSRQ